MTSESSCDSDLSGLRGSLRHLYIVYFVSTELSFLEYICGIYSRLPRMPLRQNIASRTSNRLIAEPNAQLATPATLWIVITGRKCQGRVVLYRDPLLHWRYYTGLIYPYNRCMIIIT